MFKLALIISSCISIAGLGINWLFYHMGNFMPLAFVSHGGEVSIYWGFGLRAVYLYSMRPEKSDSYHLYFDPIGLIITILVLAGIIYLILLLISKIQKS